MENYHIGIYCGIEVDGAFWFPSMIGNELMRWENGKIDIIGSFPEEKYVFLPLFREVQRYNNELYFIPCGAKAIAVYNLENGTFRRIVLPHIKDDEICVWKAVLWKDKLLLFPGLGAAIYKVDLLQKTIEVLEDWKFLFPEEKRNQNTWFALSVEVRDNLVYLPCTMSKTIMMYNLEDDSCKIVNLGEGLGYSTIAYDGEQFWLSPRGEGSIVTWTQEQGILAEYNDYPENFRGGSYMSSFVWDDYCWIFPDGANKVLKVNIATGEISEDMLLAEFCEKEDSKYAVWHTSFTYCNYVDGKFILSTGKTAEVVIYHLTEQRLERFCIDPPNDWQFDYVAALEQNYLKRYDDLKKQKREWKKKQKFHYEASEYRLKELIEDVEREKIEFVIDNKLGNEIWQKLLKC